MSGAFLASRLLGWLRVVVIGNAFGGESAQLDAFYAAFRIPDLLYPAGRRRRPVVGAHPDARRAVRQATSTDRAWRLVSTIVNLMLVALAVLGAIVVVTAPWLVETIIAPGFDAETQALTVELTRIMVLSADVPGPRGGGHRACSTPAIASPRPRSRRSCYNLAIIGAALLLAPSMGAVGLAIGVVAGAHRPPRSSSCRRSARSATAGARSSTRATRSRGGRSP